MSYPANRPRTRAIGEAEFPRQPWPLAGAGIALLIVIVVVILIVR